MISLIVSNIIWIVYSLLEGMREGFYWHFKVNSRRDCNFEIHPFFAVQRGIVISSICAFLYYTIGIYSLTSALSMMLIFSFFHNGTYYYTRNKLDNNLYQLKWKDESTTSTAKLTKLMNYRNRTIFMIIGILIQVFIYIFLIQK